MRHISWRTAHLYKKAGGQARRLYALALGLSQKVLSSRGMLWLRKWARRGLNRLRPLIGPVLRGLRRLRPVVRPIWRWVRLVTRKVLLWPRPVRLGLLAILVVITGAFLGLYERHEMYVVSPAERRLVRGSTVDKKFIQIKGDSITYNHAADVNSKANKVATLAASQLDATGQAPYQATLGKTSGEVSFADAQNQRQIKLIPQFNTSSASYQDGLVVYPQGSREKHIYTFRTNGVKEDIILPAAPADTMRLSWKLQLGDGLEARLMPGGSVGIYSANPNLFGNVQTSDAKSQQLLDKARKSGAKDYLVFALPAPYITDAHGHRDTQDAAFSLKDGVLTLAAKNLEAQQYPLSIDPTVVVTTSSDFMQGNDDGMINYGSPDEIQRSGISTGSVGATTQQTSAFTTAREYSSSVAYNGYLYIIGGYSGSPQNDIQHCPLNADGSVGTCVQQTSAFTTARYGHASVVYNGYLYIIGGNNGSIQLNDIQHCPLNADGSVGTCVQQTSAFTADRDYFAAVTYNGYLYFMGGAGSSGNQNDIQYCPFNADGSVGTCTRKTSAFTTARHWLTSVVNNGYLYIIGGADVGGVAQNDIQHCPLNADGSVGVCVQQTSAFTTARYAHSSVALNGYLYIIGGTNGTAQNDVQYCPFNANGSVGTCTQQTSAFTNARYGHASIAWNGYIYIIGGFTTTYQNDIQRLPISTVGPGGTGAVGATTQQTNAFTTARLGHSSVVSGGYLYIIGGKDDTLGTALNDIQYCPINADGSVGSCTQQTSAFTTGRYYHTSIVNNGYLYIIGGYDGTNVLNDIQYCPINQSTHAVGSCTPQSGAFTTARFKHTSVTYNNYLYIIGGNDNSTGVLNDIQYCPINQSTHAVGSCTRQTSAFTTAREGHSSVVWNGNLYIIGGDDGISNDFNDIQYCPLKSDGSVGTCTQQTGAFTTARDTFSSVVYKGNLYIIGGTNLAFTTFYNDIQYCPVNANGSVGACTQQTSAFTTTRYGHTSVAYNNYLYVIGGSHNGSHFTDIQHLAISTPGTNAFASAWQPLASVNTSVNRSGQSSVVYNNYLYLIGGTSGSSYMNDIMRCPLNADGTVGSCIDQTNAFTTPRAAHASVAYSGYLYIAGGVATSNATGCNAQGNCNDIQYCQINAGGSIGSCTQQTAAFTTPRRGLSALVYNGNLDIFGGIGGGGAYQNDNFHCPITSGVVGTCVQQTSAFSNPRANFGSAVNGSYVYIVAGDASLNGTQEDFEYCALNSNGSFGTCVDQTNVVTLAKLESPSVAANNGYLYVTGGEDLASTDYKNDLLYCPIQSSGAVGDCAWKSNAFTTGRSGHTSVVNNGYLYIAGGDNGSTPFSDIQAFALSATGNAGMGRVGASTGQNVFTGNSMYGHASVAYNGYLYIIGGQDVINGVTSDIQRCPLSANGSVGACTDQSGAFTGARQNLSAAVYNGYLYIIGGDNAGGTVYNDVQYCQINANGSIGSCTQQSGAIPYRTYHASFVYNGDIYIVGGEDDTSTLQNDVVRCPVKSDHSVDTCTDQTNAFTTARIGHSSFIYNGYLYVVGGQDVSATPLDDIQYCPLNPDGSVGACTDQTGAINQPTGFITAAVYNGYIYMSGVQDFDSETLGPQDIQYCSLNANGSTDPCIVQYAALLIDRTGETVTLYGGYLYVVGGTSTNGDTPNNIEYFPINAPALTARYEKTINLGAPVTTISSVVFNGQTVCGVNITYAVAGSNGVYGATTTITAAQPGVSYTINQGGMQYIRLSAQLDDSTCGGVSKISDMSVTYTTSPAAPTLIAPTPASGGTSLTPTFTLRTTDDSGYVLYKIDVCSNSDCSSILRTMDETASQTGWTGQDAQTGTAYVVSLTLSFSTIASHTYQAPALSVGTQYWWRAAAIDPSDTNQFGAYSAIQSFTTQSPPSVPTLIGPPSGGVSTGALPAFTLRSSDPNSDYLEYKIDLCSNSNCSSIVRTIDQTASQTGWSGQDANSNTAYASSSSVSGSTVATHTYQAPALTSGTQYWWRAYAIDPGGSNTWSSASSIQSFTVPITVLRVLGGTRILGGTQIGGN